MIELGVEDRLLFCPHCRAAYRIELAVCPLDGATLQLEETDPLLGLTINEQYTITECIAYGATSRVYRAHHTRLWRREFAIKVLLGDLIAERSTRMRFAQEAELLSRLDHPNVVSIVDFARTPEGVLYLVMDLAQGPTLAELIAKGGALPWRRAVALTQQLCHGLAHAHEQGIVHRDFKPDNVIIERASGQELARIIDFGIALPPPDDSIPRLTSAELSLGTPAYASPEQAFNIELDHRIDLFALGVTMYEMLAGVLPFSGDAHELLRNNAFQDPPRLALRNPAVAVPRQIERVVRRLMARNPKDRFQSAAEVAAALDEALAELPLTNSAQRAAAITPPRLDTRGIGALTQLALRPPPRELPIWLKAAGGVAVLGTAAVLMIGQLRSSPRPPIISAPATSIAAPLRREPAPPDPAAASATPSATPGAEPVVNSRSAVGAAPAASAPLHDQALASRAQEPRPAPPAVGAARLTRPSAGAPDGGGARLTLRPTDLDANAAAESAASAVKSAASAVERAKVPALADPGTNTGAPPPSHPEAPSADAPPAPDAPAASAASGEPDARADAAAGVAPAASAP